MEDFEQKFQEAVELCKDSQGDPDVLQLEGEKVLQETLRFAVESFIGLMDAAPPIEADVYAAKKQVTGLMDTLARLSEIRYRDA